MLVNLNDPSTHALGNKLKEDLSFLGSFFDNSIAKQIAECKIDP